MFLFAHQFEGCQRHVLVRCSLGCIYVILYYLFGRMQIRRWEPGVDVSLVLAPRVVSHTNTSRHLHADRRKHENSGEALLQETSFGVPCGRRSDLRVSCGIAIECPSK